MVISIDDFISTIRHNNQEFNNDNHHDAHEFLIWLLDSIEEALKYNPTSYDLNYNLGIVYTMLNDFQSAKICYEKAAQLNSLSYNSKYSASLCAYEYVVEVSGISLNNGTTTLA